MPWLKNIEKSHGSVAYTTMMQAEAINAYGVYHIASPKKTRENVGICLENVISLVVPGTKEKNREEKTYSLEEVKDVQSKLMLIAGKAEKGKEEVDQFVEVSLNPIEPFFSRIIHYNLIPFSHFEY